ncbi:MAG: hypothetical protein ACYSUX_14570 [Planctomycetota bacterium]|jgi:hypothetical protein
MKKYILILSIIIAITSTSCVTLPKEETRFEQTIKSTVEKQDISPLGKLTCWDRILDVLIKRQWDHYIQLSILLENKHLQSQMRLSRANSTT